MSNTKAPLIGLTVYSNKDKYHYFPEDYISAIRNAGGMPILLPTGETEYTELIKSLDGIVLTGGGDINPGRYNGEHHESIYWVNDSQDESELKLAEVALEYQKPILATCRGMQIINVLLGGTLHPHLPDSYGEKVAHRHAEDTAIDHQIDILDDSRLAKMIGTTRFFAKSWHHQSIDKLAERFRAVGFAEDGVIEAIESDLYPNLTAVQWHPEIGAQEDSIQQGLFNKWLEICRN